MSDIIRDLKTKDLISQQAHQPSGKRRRGGAKKHDDNAVHNPPCNGKYIYTA